MKSRWQWLENAWPILIITAYAIALGVGIVATCFGGALTR